MDERKLVDAVISLTNVVQTQAEDIRLSMITMQKLGLTLVELQDRVEALEYTLRNAVLTYNREDE